MNLQNVPYEAGLLYVAASRAVSFFQTKPYFVLLMVILRNDCLLFFRRVGW